MVHGAKSKFNSDCSIASTGIAGPGGGSSKKPVGLCYLAAAYNDKVRTVRFQFGNNRLRTKRRGAIAGLELLRRLLLDIK
jgi:PncC family amidohydrolase